MGKPDAANPLVRFEEGDGQPDRRRRPYSTVGCFADCGHVLLGYVVHGAVVEGD